MNNTEAVQKRRGSSARSLGSSDSFMPDPGLRNAERLVKRGYAAFLARQASKPSTVRLISK